jgi:hypothetical protein
MANKAVQTVATSPVIAALFAACDAANDKAERHQREVLEADTFKALSPDERSAHVTANNALNDAWVTTMYAVCQHPVSTAQDLRAKLAFMVEFEMGDGQDWLPTILEDVQRIEPTETPERLEALKHYEQTTADNVAALAAFNAAEEAHNEDANAEASQAYDRADARLSETMDAQRVAIRALTNSPAPSPSALLVNMQIAIDTGMIANPDIGDTLKTDLRRFSHYADKEA